jgi:putative glycosyltransferase (TIGR04372 family)
MSFDVSAYVLRLNSTAIYYQVGTEWDGRPPLLELSRTDEQHGRDVLEAMGMPRDAWFVCVQAREGGFSPLDEALHHHRNSDVLRLVPAMEFITSQGGWCLRVGEPSATPLPVLSHVIDYARHPAKSDRMDIFLCAACRFFLGNSSGLSIVSTVFGVPCALANMIPLSSLGFSSQDVSIPKLLRKGPDGRYLSFVEIFNSPIANYRLAKLYEDSGLVIEENSVQDILELSREMLVRTDGTAVYGELDEALQRRFHSLLRPGDYGYGASSRVGASFLHEHRHLLSRGDVAL